MLSRNILYYGKDAPLPERVPLRAGPLSLVYEQGDLRSVFLGKHEVLRRVYVAVRDRNWGTIASSITNPVMQVETDRFQIAYDAIHRAGAIDFLWHGEIQGDAQGRICFRMDGVARTTFLKNRIGFCILHPARLAGKQALVEHSHGSRQRARFVEDISAEQPVLPFADLRAILHRIAPGCWAEVRFTGDIFEMEDQRLWTDASYKTFCTPLSQPYPVEVKAGTRICQSVTLQLHWKAASRRHKIRDDFNPVSHAPVRMASQRDWKPLPALGVSAASHGEALSERSLQRLRALNLHHLRVELPLSEPGFQTRLQQASEQASALGIPLEVALAVRADFTAEDLDHFRRVLDVVRPSVCGWLVFPAQEPYAGGNPSAGIARAAWEILKPRYPTIPLAVGTNTDFIFLKRTTLPLPYMDQVCITLNPQVHAFDNQSLAESLQAQPMLIEGARRLAKGLPVVVSPVTLKPRFNPYATRPAPETSPGELPCQVDPRQASLFGAGWTLGSLGAMVAGGAERVTYYETTGWRGVMETELGSPLPQAFPSLPGSVFPLYHVMADYGEFAGGQAAALVSSEPWRMAGLALRKPDRERYLLANLTPGRQTVVLEGLEGDCRLHLLDETNAEAAIQSPEAFHQEAGARIRAAGKAQPLEINPFGILRLDRMLF